MFDWYQYFEGLQPVWKRHKWTFCKKVALVFSSLGFRDNFGQENRKKYHVLCLFKPSDVGLFFKNGTKPLSSRICMVCCSFS
jgi:hypothetical protein